MYMSDDPANMDILERFLTKQMATLDQMIALMRLQTHESLELLEHFSLNETVQDLENIINEYAKDESLTSITDNCKVVGAAMILCWITGNAQGKLEKLKKENGGRR